MQFYAKREVDSTGKDLQEAYMNSLNELIGLEGSGSREYFKVFGRIFREEVPFNFNKRSRRPPEDPANAI
ncbi:MAG: CRISPR-associated endonuclease Cas1 [Firmicutes bacterium]|nr:CRISPR-associated endonuclease Cas1 [Bacillota bacterium]